jgi:Tol biopolymer transport system component
MSALVVMDTSGAEVSRVTRDTAFDNWAPAWSRDSQWIFWTRSHSGIDDGQSGIWRAHPDGSMPLLIVPNADNASCSPLDTALVFNMYDKSSNTFDIWMSAEDGTGLRRVIAPPAGEATIAQNRPGLGSPTVSRSHGGGAQ